MRVGAAGTLFAAVVTCAAAIGLAAPAAHAAPRIVAPEAILVEPETGDVLYSRNADEPRPVASTTKLMTALVVLEHDPLDDVFSSVPYQALAAESRLGLRAGERMTVRDLLRALLVASANDAAATLAVGTSGSMAAFVEQMNARARELGLVHTRFANPIGLDDPDNYSSAADLVNLTRALRAMDFFRRTVAMSSARLSSGARRRVVDNRNDLVGRVPFVDGVKTGHTLSAGYVLVGSATRGGVSVISTVLGDSTAAARDADTLALLRYGLAQFRRVTIVHPSRVLATAKVRYRSHKRVGLVPSRPVVRILRRGERPAVVVHAPARVKGPLPAGAVVGSVVVRLRGRVVARVPLVTAAAVPKVTLLDRAVALAVKPGTLAVAGLIVAGLAGLVVVRRRRQAGQRLENV